jgi:two-component system cell cycle sensor histidine kinase/response regulator CckA
MNATATAEQVEELRVLIVEDNDDDALLVREMLRDEGGFVSARAETIRGAAAELSEGAFDCVLLDLSLPDSDGITTVAELRAIVAGTPIVVLTGLDDELRGLEAIRAGAEDYLVKGRVSGHALARIMRFAVARHAAASAERTDVLEEDALLAREFGARVPHKLVLLASGGLFAVGVVAQLVSSGSAEVDVVYALAVGVIALGLGPRWGIGAAVLATAFTVGLKSDGAGTFAYVTQALGYVVLGMLGGTFADTLRNLRDNRARHLAEVVGTTDAAILSVSLPGGVVTSWNRGCEALTGWTAEEAIGERASFLSTPDSDAQAERDYRALLDGETVVQETRWMRRDGGQVDVSVSAAPLAGPAGGVHGASVVATDISAQAATVRALRRAEERFRGAFAHAPAGMAVVSLDPTNPGRLLQVNPALVHLTGYSEAGLLATNLQDVLRAPGRFAADAPSASHMGHLTGERPIERADGAVIWVEVSTSTYLDEDGAALHSIAQIQDITARKSVDSVRSQLAEIVSGSTDAILTEDADGRILSWNDAAETLYGYNAVEAIGSEVSELVPPERRAEYRQRRRAVLAGGSLEGLATQRRTKDGRTLEISMTLSPIRDESGAIVGASSIERDITQQSLAAEALRSSEEKLRQIVDTADEGIVVLDLNGCTTFANLRLAAMLGTEPEAMLDLPFEGFIGEAGAARVSELIDGRLDGASGHHNEAFRRPDGSDGWVHVSGSPMHGPSGEVTGALGMVTDVTDVLVAQREAKEMEAMLHQSQRLESMGQLAGGVAHDMNNLLAVIMNFADFASEAVEGGPGTEELREIRQASESAAGLIRQLLLFARQEVTRPESLSLTPLLEGLENLLRRAVGEQIHFSMDYEPGLPAIKADAGMIEQVAMNLVVNARDAMPHGGRLSVSTITCDLDAAAGPDIVPGAYVRLRVADDGEGMTGEVAARAFDPFFSTKPRGSGTGLGLATVYGIAARFGGHVEIDSEPGQGTRVDVYFPTDRSDRNGASSPAEAAPDRPAAGGTILLVEDDDGVRRVIARILEAHGYDVLTAARPREALELVRAREAPLDLLFTDVVMPEMSGPKLAVILQEHQPGLRVVFSSGHTDRPDELPAGAHFVSKPFTRSAVLAKVAAATAKTEQP